MGSEIVEGGPGWRPLIPLFGSTFQNALAVIMINVSLPTIKQTLNLSAPGTGWIVSIYYLPLLVLAPVSGRLADAFGARRVLVAGLVAQFSGSMLVAFAGTYPALIIGRLLQGSGSSALISLSLSVISTLYPLHRRGTALSIMYLSAPTANAIGPISAVFLVETFGWSAIFYMLAVLSVVNAANVLWLVPRLESPAAAQSQPFDWGGMVMLGLAMSGLIFMLNGGEMLGLNGPQRTLLLAGAGFSFVVFALIEHHNHAPLVDPGFFRKADFSFASLSISLRMFAYVGIQFLLPLFLSEVQGRPLPQVGAVFLVQPVVQMVAIPASGRLADRFGSRAPSVLGFALMAATTGFAITLGAGSPIWMVILVLGTSIFGGAFALVPLGKAAIRSIDDDHVGAASGVYNMTRFVGAMLSPALLAAVLDGTVLRSVGGLGPFQRSFLLLCGISILALAFSLVLDIQQADPQTETEASRP